MVAKCRVVCKPRVVEPETFHSEAQSSSVHCRRPILLSKGRSSLQIGVQKDYDYLERWSQCCDISIDCDVCFVVIEGSYHHLNGAMALG